MTARELPPCGTDAAYQRHRRCGEPVDDACRRAHSAGNAAYWKSGAQRPKPCTNCDKPRPLSTGAHGWCRACYARWARADRPEGGPPPPRYGDITARREDYFWLRDTGESTEWAAERVGITVATARAWDASRLAKPIQPTLEAS